MTARNAVVVRAGRSSKHAEWMQGEAPEFDLIIAAYEPIPDHLMERASRFELLPGPKFRGLHALFSKHPDLVAQYDLVALIDDDIECQARDTNQCFRIGLERGLSLWQPSLTYDSHFSHTITLHNRLFYLRYTNFVEMMCPFFRSDHLRAALPLFGMGYECGVDFLWSRLRDESDKAYAVVDAVQVKHGRLIGTQCEALGMKKGYPFELQRIQRDLDVRFRGPVAYAAIGVDGREIRGRSAMAMRIAPQFFVIPRAVYPLARHIGHTLVWPIEFERFLVPEANKENGVGSVPTAFQ